MPDDCCLKFETVLLLKWRDIKSNIWEAIDDQLLPIDIQEESRQEFFTFIRQNQSSVLLVTHSPALWVDNSAAASLSLNGYFNCP